MNVKIRKRNQFQHQNVLKKKNAVVYIDTRRDLLKLSLCEGWAEGNTLCTDKTVQNEIKHQYDLVIIALNSYDIFL